MLVANNCWTCWNVMTEHQSQQYKWTYWWIWCIFLTHRTKTNFLKPHLVSYVILFFLHIIITQRQVFFFIINAHWKPSINTNIVAFCALTETHRVISAHPSGSVMLKLLFSFSRAKQRVFQWKAPTAPGSSTDGLFVFVLIAAQTHACDCTW